MTKVIRLTQGKVALVDDQDFEFLSQWKWYAKNEHSKWYACRQERAGKAYKTIKMHRVIMNAPTGMEVDHRDGDGLNNQRENLRVCSRRENVRNRRPLSKTGYKGVSIGNGKFQAIIQNVYLGTFPTAEAAARAYDKAAYEAYGEFAYLNFPKVQS